MENQKEDVPITEKEEEEKKQNWSEAVEDLVTAGDVEGAISLLETAVSQLEARSPSFETVSDLQLSSVLTELAKLYSSKDFSLKSDDLLSRASLLKQRALPSHSRDEESVKSDLNEDKDSKCNVALSGNDLVRDGSSSAADGHLENSSTKLPGDASAGNGSSDDDWEAIADRTANELLPSPSLPSVSNVSLEDTKIQTPKRRGRGTFSYEKHELYSDQQSDMSFIDDIKDEDLCKSKQQNTESRHSKYGTRHVLVLADFPPSTRTIELEKLFEDFRDRVAIRWVNDTAALAVFQTPSIALEACNCIRCPFTVHILDEDEILMDSIKTRDLEPPRQRPQTSARTAQRLIAHGMGLKLPSTTFGSRELKTQEEARKNRIATRQKLRDDAWGDDER